MPAEILIRSPSFFLLIRFAFVSTFNTCTVLIIPRVCFARLINYNLQNDSTRRSWNLVPPSLVAGSWSCELQKEMNTANMFPLSTALKHWTFPKRCLLSRMSVTSTSYVPNFPEHTGYCWGYATLDGSAVMLFFMGYTCL